MHLESQMFGGTIPSEPVQTLRRRLVQWRFRRWLRREVQSARFAGFGAGTVIHPPLTVTHRDRVVVGERTYVLAGSWLACATDRPGARITIGDGTYLGRDLTIHCGASVSIGDDVMGSDRLLITDLQHVPGAGGARLDEPRPVRIEDGVFLGTGAIVLPGVTVGARSLVAAGAVVAQDVPPNSVVAGNPARVVRHYDRATAGWRDGPPG